MAYQISIQMSPQTVQSLVTNGFALYAFQAVQGASGGRPLAWVQTTALAENVTLSWTETYQAYLSISQGVATMMASYPIDVGQTLYVTGSGGAGDVKDGGVAGAISVVNQTTQPYTSGTALQQGGTASPLCAFPLYGGNLVVVAPTQQVFLMFSSVGGESAANQSLGPGVLVDLSGASERTLSYDINQGWSSGGAAWARPYPPLTDLGALLIQPLAQAPSMLASEAPEQYAAEAVAAAPAASEVSAAADAPETALEEVAPA